MLGAWDPAPGVVATCWLVMVAAVPATGSDVHPPPARVSEGAHIPDQATYEAMYKRSVEDPETFWGEHARKNLSWFRDFDAVRQGSFEKGDVAWFTNGKINVSWNCLDRHIATRGDQTAIIFEGDELGSGRSYTYSEALAEVCKIANVLRKWGVRRGDTVAVYMPMIPDLAFVMLACARIGAVHSVVFAGFSANSLRDRIVDAQSKWVICADEGKRGGRTIGLKVIVDKAISESGGVVERCFMFHRTNNPEVPTTDIDVNMEEEVLTVRPYCPCEEMDSEDNLFLLYTSGSTGKSPCPAAAVCWACVGMGAYNTPCDRQAQGHRSHPGWLPAVHLNDAQVCVRLPRW